MDAIDRRSALRTLLCGAVTAGLGVGLLANSAEALPLAIEKELGRKADEIREKAQPVQARPRPPGRPIPHHRRRHHRRRRRWDCWWHRGRRHCGWRWR